MQYVNAGSYAMAVVMTPTVQELLDDLPGDHEPDPRIPAFPSIARPTENSASAGRSGSDRR